jgi:hypothetical protein
MRSAQPARSLGSADVGSAIPPRPSPPAEARRDEDRALTRHEQSCRSDSRRPGPRLVSEVCHRGGWCSKRGDPPGIARPSQGASLASPRLAALSRVLRERRPSQESPHAPTDCPRVLRGGIVMLPDSKVEYLPAFADDVLSDVQHAQAPPLKPPRDWDSRICPFAGASRRA